MSKICVLPDVNLLLAYGWRSHANHDETRRWFAGLPKFATCAITELGFLRVSMSPGYRASLTDALAVLASLTSQPTARFLDCKTTSAALPPVSSYKDITDAYLVALVRQHSCRFATLDEGVLKAAWYGYTTRCCHQRMRYAPLTCPL